MINDHRPVYTQADVKQALLTLGFSGTIYALVMPETEAAQASIIDGGDRHAVIDELFKDYMGGAPVDIHALRDSIKAKLDQHRAENYFARFREPWTQKQDPAHEIYFNTWLDWARPVLTIDPNAFPFRYPTAGASEGIFKIMAEYAARQRKGEIDPTAINRSFHAAQAGGAIEKPVAAASRPRIHVFDGEYEGFSAYAAALNIDVVRHSRNDWRSVPQHVAPGEQFWISQPSAIDGNLWMDFADFTKLLYAEQPQAQLIPDLTYVGNVAKPYGIDLTSPNIPLFVMSSSKPCGMYYHRVGGVFSKTECPSLFGNKWFKGLQPLAQATEMMRRHTVFELPRRYRAAQLAAVEKARLALGVPDLEPCDVSIMAKGSLPHNSTDLQKALLRGRGDGQIVRVCLTPTMTALIDPRMAPETVARLWGASDANPQVRIEP